MAGYRFRIWQTPHQGLMSGGADFRNTADAAPIACLKVDFEIVGLKSSQAAEAIFDIVKKAAKLPQDAEGSLLKELREQGRRCCCITVCVCV